MAPKSKAEQKYLKFIYQYRNIVYSAHEDTVQEGFEYFGSEEYRIKYPENKMSLGNMFFSGGLGHFFKMFKIFAKYMKSMMKGRKECFTDFNVYCKELIENVKIKLIF